MGRPDDPVLGLRLESLHEPSPGEQGLELHGRFPVVGPHVAHSEIERERVEDPAEGGCLHALGDELPEDLRLGIRECGGILLPVHLVDGEAQSAQVRKGLLSSQEGDVLEMCQTFVGTVIAGEDLASPSLPVVAVSGAVEGQRGHAGETVAVGHERCDMSPMVLHVDQVRGVFLGKLRGESPVEVGGMEILRHHLRLAAHQGHLEAYGLLEVFGDPDALAVPDVLRGIDPAARGDGSGQILLGTDGHGIAVDGDLYVRGDGPPGFPDVERPVSVQAYDAVVGAVDDLLVVQEVHVGSESHDVPVVEDHGFPGDVGRGHDEGILPQQVEKHHLHACVGQEYAYVVQSRGYEVVDREVPLLDEDDGAEGRSKLLLLFRSGVAVLPGRLQILHHHGEGLLLPAVPFPHACGVGEGAADVHASPALGDADPAFAQHLRECRYGVALYGLPILPDESIARSALRAAHGLVVEPPVRGSGVFPSAGRAHGESVHGRGDAVVGQGAEQGEPRSAVRAAGEGISLPPALVQVLEASGTYRGVGGDGESLAPPPFGFADRETLHIGRYLVRDLLDGIYPRKGREIGKESRHEKVAVIDVDGDVGALVADGPPKTQRDGCTVDRGTESHTLHSSLHDEPHYGVMCLRRHIP